MSAVDAEQLSERLLLCGRLRKHQIWLMRYDEGLTLEQIAARTRRTKQAIGYELERINTLLTEEVKSQRERIRNVHQFRLEKIIGVLLRKLEKADAKEAASLAQALNRTMAAQRKMWGVDAPARIIVSEEDVDAEIRRELDRLARGRQTGVPHEAAGGPGHVGNGRPYRQN